MEKEGYSVFMDTHKMGSGDFTKKLNDEIRESCNIVVIVSKDCFPHKKEGTDFFLYEIEQSFRQGKNVIPVYFDDMRYEDIEAYLSWMEDFHKYNAITYHIDDPEGSIRQIISFLKTKNEEETHIIGEGIELRLNDELSFKMIYIEGGSFSMGSPKNDKDALKRERPQHWIELHDYYIGETVVTQKLWRAVMKGNPSHFKGDNHPVENVAWEDETEKNVSITEFVRKLNDNLILKKQIPEGMEFRLPTEAEWEYAARGGQKDMGCKYSGSNILEDVACFWENSGNRRLSGTWDWDVIEKNSCKTHAVKSKKPNELGLFDMSGNVREWCWDYYGEKYYAESPSINPQGPSSGTERVLRGGSWCGDARHCRVAYRSGRNPKCRDTNIGFRLVLAAPIA